MNGPTFATQPGSTVTVHGSAVRTAARPAPKTPAHKPEEAEANSALRILTYLRLHWLAILFCGSLIGTGLAYLAWSIIPVKFESYALLQVASTPSSIASGGDPNRGRTDFATYIKTTAQLIKSEFVLNAALNDPKYRIAELPTLADQKDPVKYLDEKLVVTYSDGSEVVRVSLEGDRPEDVRKIVDAVKDAYYREVVEKELFTKKDFRQKVLEAHASLEELLKKKVGPKLPAMAANPGAAPVPGGVVPAGGVQVPGGVVPAVALENPSVLPNPIVNPVGVPEPDAAKRARFPVLLNKIFSLENQIGNFPLELSERKNEIESLKKQIEALKSGPPSADTMAAAEKDPEVLHKEYEAKRARDTANYLEKIVNNPTGERVARAKADATKAEDEAKKCKLDCAFKLENGKRQLDANRLFVALDKAERDLRTAMERERVAKKMLEDAKKELAELPPELRKEDEKEAKFDPANTDLMTHDSMYGRLTAQLIGLDFELQSPPRVRKLQDASVPSQKDTKKQILGTVAAGLMGFALVGLAIVGLETKARKVSSLAELKTVGPTPVVGVIPWQPDGSASRDPIKRADVNEAIDKLRSYVAQTWLSRGATTVAITSPLGDEGKSFAAFGLASSLAQAGYKTLLVDFDLRHPTLHAYAGSANAIGVCDLLRGEGDLRKAVQVLPSGLAFLPAGQWSDEARQAAVGGRLEALLSKLKEPFDCVVLLGTALLTAAESVEIARRSEVVLLCALYRETRLPLLKRATDRVATMEIPYSGVVYLGSTSNEALC